MLTMKTKTLIYKMNDWMVYNEPRDLTYMVVGSPNVRRDTNTHQQIHKDIVTGLLHRAFSQKNGPTLSARSPSDIIKSCQTLL